MYQGDFPLVAVPFAAVMMIGMGVMMWLMMRMMMGGHDSREPDHHDVRNDVAVDELRSLRDEIASLRREVESSRAALDQQSSAATGPVRTDAAGRKDGGVGA